MSIHVCCFVHVCLQSCMSILLSSRRKLRICFSRANYTIEHSRRAPFPAIDSLYGVHRSNKDFVDMEPPHQRRSIITRSPRHRRRSKWIKREFFRNYA